MFLTNSVSDIIDITRGLIKDNLKTDGRDSFIYSSDNIFTISEDFVSPSTIKVFQNGTELASQDFSYDSDNNQVTISFVSSGLSLTENDTILIKYSYYEKYSDTELEGFLKSALSYFPQHRYKKTFEIVDSKVVAVNDINPTLEEIYFISIVTSILVDPKNTDISIPDLRISAERDESDQQQIAKAFRNFTRFVGEVSYRPIDVTARGELT